MRIVVYDTRHKYISLADLEYVRMSLEDFHWSFNAPEQLPGPSDATGDGRQVSRRSGTGLLGLVH